MEFEGRSEEDAVEKACSAFSMAEADLDYTVLDEGSGGLFGLGSRPVRIRASVPEGYEVPEPAKEERREAKSDGGEEKKGIVGPAPEKAEQAREVAAALAEKMGMNSVVTVRDEETEIVVEINEVEDSTDVAELLGGGRPPALPSFQFLLNKIVNRFPDDRKHIVVEASSVEQRLADRRAEQKQQRKPRNIEPPEDVDPELAQLAIKLAERSTMLNKVITVHPMPSSDRRAIHQTIMAIDGVETVSEGEGLYRRMHIVPASLRSGNKKRRRRRRRRPEGEEAPAVD